MPFRASRGPVSCTTTAVEVDGSIGSVEEEARLSRACLFASVPVGNKVWLINELAKIAHVAGSLHIEVHPPVDGEGQETQVDLEVMAQKLRLALGQDTGAIHWEFARRALESATGVPTVVGLRAHLEQASADNTP